MLFSMQDYQLIWYVIIGLVLVLFAVTAGFDLGIGILLPFIGRKNIERRVIINAIGPTWDGNQVWLIIAGGALFVIWPYAYALAFSGFYGAMLILLWSLFLRPVGFEWRAKINKDSWRAFWDIALFLGSLIPALSIGILLGNLMEGVPFYYLSSLRVIYTGHFLQLLNVFSIGIGLITVFLLIMHGALYLQLRTESVIRNRCRVAAAVFGVLFLLGFTLAGLGIKQGLVGYHLIKAAGIENITGNIVQRVSAGLLENYSRYPWMITAPIVAYIGTLFAMLTGFSKRLAGFGFFASVFAIMGTIATFGFSLFPFVIPNSQYPDQSLTAWNASASHYTLQAIFIATIICVPTIGVYTIWVFRKIWGKVTVQSVEENEHALY